MNRRVVIGLVLLLLAAGAIGAFQLLPKPDNRPVVTVKGFMGSEKVGFMQDPSVIKILNERYKLNVAFTSVGSLEQVSRPDSDAQDFLWPSNEVALQLYKDNHNGVANAQTIFNSPIVFYSWDEVTKALMAKGYVTQADNVYYMDDVPGFVKIITDTTEWKTIGLPQLYGRVAIISTDPTKSNSGNMFAGMLANMLVGGRVADDTSIVPVLPIVKNYFNSLGFLEVGSADLFKVFVRTGVGAKPIIVGYESQMIEFSIANEANRDQILKVLRIIYPRPTVWSSHPLIALNSKGKDLQTALQDPELQKIAWEQHGFRSGLIGIQNDPKVLNVAGIPATITSVLPLPRPSVMDQIIKVLTQ